MVSMAGRLRKDSQAKDPPHVDAKWKLDKVPRESPYKVYNVLYVIHMIPLHPLIIPEKGALMYFTA